MTQTVHTPFTLPLTTEKANIHLLSLLFYVRKAPILGVERWFFATDPRPTSLCSGAWSRHNKEAGASQNPQYHSCQPLMPSGGSLIPFPCPVYSLTCLQFNRTHKDIQEAATKCKELCRGLPQGRMRPIMRVHCPAQALPHASPSSQPGKTSLAGFSPLPASPMCGAL